jgi:hypothetical protein
MVAGATQREKRLPQLMLSDTTPRRVGRAASCALLLILQACGQAADTTIAQRSTLPAATSTSGVTHGILTDANFRADKARILGLGIGQTWDEARKIVEADSNLTIREHSSTRFYVYDRAANDEDDAAVFYCQWPDGAAGMGRLVIYPGIARFLPPADRRLFLARSAASLPADVQHWLGPEDRAVVSLKARSVKITDHVYEKRALEISDVRLVFHSPQVFVSFVRPDLLSRDK